LGSPPANRAPKVNAGADQTIRLPASAVLDATVTDDGLPLTPGFVTTLWVKESGPDTGVVTFANPHAIDTTASFSEPGRYVVELEASDGELTGTGAVAIDVLENIPGLMFLDRQVASGAGDAEEKTSGAVSVTSNDLELVTDGSNVQKVGLRFAGISIPKGATIQAAYIQFQAKETQSEPTNLLIRGQAADNAADFTKTRFNVSSRPRTSASVPWSPSPWTTVGEAVGPQRTPDLSAIVQEIVNRTGWSSGNALVFIITGTGHRTADAFEGNAAGAARLHIEFN
jgi:K319-like protein